MTINDCIFHLPQPLAFLLEEWVRVGIGASHGFDGFAAFLEEKGRFAPKHHGRINSLASI